MNRSILLTVAAVIAIIYGLAFVISPAWVSSLHGMASSPQSELLGRGFGAALLGLGVMAGLARNAPGSVALSAILRGSFVFNVIQAVVLLIAVTGGVISAMGWVPVVINVLLAIGFAYYGFIDKANA
jgi:hypothetical protein